MKLSVLLMEYTTITCISFVKSKLKLHTEFVFVQIFMKSPENGSAELKARHPLNCETKESYELTIAAVACNGQISER